MKEQTLSIGRWDKLPHYNVVGRPTDFYIWINENEKTRSKTSKWIRGKVNLYSELSVLHKKDKKEFIKKLYEIYSEIGDMLSK